MKSFKDRRSKSKIQVRSLQCFVQIMV
jgi:hypothetical protein